MTDSSEREHIARELAEELNVVVGTNGAWWFKTETGLPQYHLCEPGRDALISREVRVRELEAEIRELRINNSKLGMKICDLALHTKEEKE